MKKRLFIILQCFIFILLFTGCWSREEPKNLAMVNSILYDIDDKGQCLATIEIINTASSGGGKGGLSEEKTSALILEGKGHFASDTIFRDNNNLEKVIFAGLNKTRFFSEKSAVSGIHSTMDYIARDFLTDETPYMVVVPGKDPKRLYACTTGLTDMMGNYIDNLHYTQPRESNESVFVRTLDFMKDFYMDGKEPVMGLAQILESEDGLSNSFQSGAQISLNSQNKKNMSSKNQKNSDQDNSGQNVSDQSSPAPNQGKGAVNQASPSPSPAPGNAEGLKQSSPSTSNQNSKIYHIRYEGLAAFKGDKLVGYMNGNEARAYNMIVNNYGSSVVIAPVENNYEVFTIERGKTKIKTDILSDGQIEINISIKPTVSVRQINNISLDTRKDSVIKAMEQTVSRQLQTEVTQAIKKAQTQFQSDIFGFGATFHAQHPKEFMPIKNNWNNYFAKAKINVMVASSITREGKVWLPFAMED